MIKSKDQKNRGWIVVIAGMSVNLALGILYSWGAFQSVLVHEPYNWTATQSQIPYMIACFIFAVSMVPSGRVQDKIGPHKVITLAGILVLIGLVLSGYLITPVGLSITFGVIFGLAMGLGYAAPTPAAVKWFGPHKRGLISGIVVSGFGLAGIYAAPLVRYLMSHYGLAKTFIILGVAYGILIIVLAQFISNPPKSYVIKHPPAETTNKYPVNSKIDFDWHQMLRTPSFYKLWIMFCIGTFAGLFIIGQIRSIGIDQANLSDDMTFWLIAVYSLFNWGGRIGCGIISDKFGSRSILILMFVIQVIVFVSFKYFTAEIPLFVGTAFVGFTFGGMLTIFPAITANTFGIKNLGVNYGLVFTAWGGGGVFGPLVGGIVRDLTGTYEISYIISAVLSVVGIILAVSMKASAKTGNENV